MDLDEEWDGGSGGFLLLTEEEEVIGELIVSLLLTDDTDPEEAQLERPIPLCGSETGLARGHLLKPSRRMMSLCLTLSTYLKFTTMYNVYQGKV